MLITATTILVLAAIALFCIIGGYVGKVPELYFFGTVVLLFAAFMIFTQGIAEKVGENSTADNVGNRTTTAISYQYESNKGYLSQGVALVFTVLALALILKFATDWEDEKKNRAEEELR